MIASSTPPHARIYRPVLWRYVVFRCVIIGGACLTALDAVRLMETVRAAVPQLQAVDLAIVGGVYLLLDTLYAPSDRDGVALKLSHNGISVTRRLSGEVTIPWAQFDWRASQRRGILDRLLGQSYIYGTAGQRIWWQRITLAPADVQAILEELDQHGNGR